MNNQQFKSHFCEACECLSVDNYKDRIFIVYPIVEDVCKYNSTDDIMRLLFLPKVRKLSFENVINIFTWKEGYYPLLIKISLDGQYIKLETSLRMRKCNKICDNPIYPFKIDI